MPRRIFLGELARPFVADQLRAEVEEAVRAEADRVPGLEADIRGLRIRYRLTQVSAVASLLGVLVLILVVR